MSITDDSPLGERRSGPQTGGSLRRRRAGGWRRTLDALRAHWETTEPFVGVPRSEWPSSLRLWRRVGFGILVLELIGFFLWSSTQVSQFSLGQDFAADVQAAWLFTHGNVGMDQTIWWVGSHGAAWPWLRNSMELEILPMAAILRIWSNPVALKWLQDLALIGAQAVAFGWICDILGRRAQDEPDARGTVALALLGLVLLVVNPWWLWASSFDLHSEPFATVFVTGAARDLHRNRRTAWLWAVGSIACGIVCTTYVVLIALSFLATSRSRLKVAGPLMLSALAWFIALEASQLLKIGGPTTFGSITDGGASSLNNVRSHPRVVHDATYSDIARALVHHPLNLLRALWPSHANFWATISPAGMLGFLWLPALITSSVVLFQGGFYRELSIPGFQNIVTAPIVAVGTVIALIWLARRMRTRLWVWYGVTAVVAANTIAWGALWFGKASTQWLVVTPQAVRVLKDLQRQIKPQDEVIASQGVLGGFAEHRLVYTLAYPETVQVRPGRRVWVILAPIQGIELVEPSQVYAAIDSLEHRPGWRLVKATAGIWAYEWTPPPGTHVLRLSRPGNRTPGWTLAGVAGRPVTSGRATSQWYTVSNGRRGYVIDRAFSRKVLPGTYHANVSISSTVPNVNVELWDTYTSTLLARSVLPPTRGRVTVSLTGHVEHITTPPVINAWGPWAIAPPEQPGDPLEVRVWSPGGHGVVKVFAVSFRELS